MKMDPLFSYLSVLSIIQPARIQDIEKEIETYLGCDQIWMVKSGVLRGAQALALEEGLISAVRKGVYFLTAKGRILIRRKDLEKSIDNRRLFLMKVQRRSYKR